MYETKHKYLIVVTVRSNWYQRDAAALETGGKSCSTKGATPRQDRIAKEIQELMVFLG